MRLHQLPCVLFLALASSAICYAQNTYTWSTTTTSTAWLNSNNWTGGLTGTFPGTDNNSVTTADGNTGDIAQFSTLAISGNAVGVNFNNTGTNTGIGNNGNANGRLTLGAVDALSTMSKAVVIGKSDSATITSALQLNGRTLGGVDNIILRNSSGFSLTVAGFAGGTGSAPMTLQLLNSTTSTIVAAGAGNINISAIISESGGARSLTVNSTGTGIVTLSGVNTYTGNTTVSAGTLALNVAGSINTSPIITVNSGATYNVSAVTGGYSLGLTSVQTLQGTGTVTGALTVASGSTIRGDSGTDTGTLTTGNVTVQSGGRLGVQLGTGTAASRLNTSAGILNLNSNSIIDPNGTFDGGGNRTLATLSSSAGGLVVGGTTYNSNADIASYTFTTGDTGLRAFGALQFDVTGLGLTQGDQLVLSRSGNNLVLNFSPVPEPASMLALCGLVVGGVVGVRKLRRKAVEVTPAA